jgi:predicted nucleic acid-binding protein
MIRTFADAGVLIAAARGQGGEAAAAERLLADPDRMFIASPFLELEVLPKAVYHRQTAEADAYRAYLHGIVSVTVPGSDELTIQALALAQRFGLSACDALHGAAALAAACDELVTTELPGKPLYRLDGTLRVRWLMAG